MGFNLFYLGIWAYFKKDYYTAIETSLNEAEIYLEAFDKDGKRIESNKNEDEYGQEDDDEDWKDEDEYWEDSRV